MRLARVEMREPSSFWRDRLRTYGHTGWSDPLVYAYDQLERLKLIKAAVMNYRPEGGCAFDFGCGTGDFSQMLLEMGFTVCGYDPYVKPVIRDRNFTYLCNDEEIVMMGGATDLVLCVTTLDHILADCDAIKALNVIRSRIRNGGVFLMLEYALDSAGDRDRLALHNEYQAFRTLGEWMDLLGRSSFRIEEIVPFPHPELRPSMGYSVQTKFSHANSTQVFALSTRPLIRLVSSLVCHDVSRKCRERS